MGVLYLNGLFELNADRRAGGVDAGLRPERRAVPGVSVGRQRLAIERHVGELARRLVQLEYGIDGARRRLQHDLDRRRFYDEPYCATLGAVRREIDPCTPHFERR